MEQHIAFETAENIRAGLSPTEARRQALLKFGARESIEQDYRAERGLPGIETWLHDVRYSLRVLRKSPGFTLVAVLTLALGIGANTAVFSLLYALAYRNLPVPHPQQLVRFGAQWGDEPFVGLSLPMIEELARNQKVFSSVFAWWGDGVFNVEIDGAMSRADIWAVTGNFQTELGAVPEIGRLIGPDDVDLHSPIATQVAVLDYNYWQRRYGRSPGVLGKTIKIEGIPFTVVGVSRRGFGGISAEAPPEITVPLNAEPLIAGKTDIQKHLRRPDPRWLEAAGRLRPEATLQTARAQLDALWPPIREALLPAGKPLAERAHFLGLHLKVESGARGASFLRNRFTQPLYFLLGLSGLVLLVACVNLASLTLARAASRGHEIGVRIALGASRARLVRQMLCEAVLLSLAGMLGGLAFAYWGSRVLSKMIIKEIYVVPAAVHVTPDLRILGFATAAAVITGVLFGLAPAWRSTREDPTSVLQAQSRMHGSETAKLGRGLIVTQVALSFVLVAGAGLFIRTLAKLHAVDPGFRVRGMLDARLSAMPGGYKNVDWVSYYHQLLERVSGEPEVVSAALIHMQPGGPHEWTEEARLKDAKSPTTRVDFDMVMPGAFRVMGIPLLRGRDFTWQDDIHAPHIAIVSRSFAEQLVPGGDPIGQIVEITSQPKWQNVEIVGIAADVTLYDLHKHAPPTVYVSPLQYDDDWAGWGEILIQTDMPVSAMAGRLRQVVGSFGREYVASVEAISQGMERSLLRERVTAMLSAFFGGLALLLAAIGLYGLMAYSVTRRTREIGIRMALGARREPVRWLILRETLLLAAAGIAIGLPCAAAASRLVATLLYGVSTRDPLTLAVPCGVLIVVAAIAGWLPARRATRVDPMLALRDE
jgi:predicted permease